MDQLGGHGAQVDRVDKYFLLKGVELTNAAQAPEVNSPRFNKKDTFDFSPSPPPPTPARRAGVTEDATPSTRAPRRKT